MYTNTSVDVEIYYVIDSKNINSNSNTTYLTMIPIVIVIGRTPIAKKAL